MSQNISVTKNRTTLSHQVSPDHPYRYHKRFDEHFVVQRFHLCYSIYLVIASILSRLSQFAHFVIHCLENCIACGDTVESKKIIRLNRYYRQDAFREKLGNTNLNYLEVLQLIFYLHSNLFVSSSPGIMSQRYTTVSAQTQSCPRLLHNLEI